MSRPTDSRQARLPIDGLFGTKAGAVQQELCKAPIVEYQGEPSGLLSERFTIRYDHDNELIRVNGATVGTVKYEGISWTLRIDGVREGGHVQVRSMDRFVRKMMKRRAKS